MRSRSSPAAIGAPTPSTHEPPALPEEVRFTANDGLVWRRADARPGPAWHPVDPVIARGLLTSFRAEAWSQTRADQLQRAMEDVGLIETKDAA